MGGCGGPERELVHSQMRAAANGIGPATSSLPSTPSTTLHSTGYWDGTITGAVVLRWLILSYYHGASWSELELCSGGLFTVIPCDE